MIVDYPTQLDEIDQWLHDNFGILPGACSSTENLRYSVARRVAEALWPKTQSLPSDVDEVAKAYEDKLGYYECMNQWPSVAFKAGAEWQKSQMISALKNDGELPIEFIDKFNEIDRNAFQNGQKNVKERLLKDAVKGTVCKDKKCVWIELIPNALPDYEDTEPVKCVVMKED